MNKLQPKLKNPNKPTSIQSSITKQTEKKKKKSPKKRQRKPIFPYCRSAGSTQIHPKSTNNHHLSTKQQSKLAKNNHLQQPIIKQLPH